MDPAKCLEILGNRGTCSGLHGAHHHGHAAGPTPPSQAGAAAAAGTGGENAGGRGQVINLATGSNETRAAVEAASGLMAAMATGSPSAAADSGCCPSKTAAGPCGDALEKPAAPPTSAAPYADSDGGAGHSCGAGGEAGAGAQRGGGGGEAGARDPGLNLPTATAGQEEERGGLQGLQGMPTGALVASFRRAQEERVALYRKFNGGLKEALRIGDYSGYPALCCEVTAGFSVLSKAINAIEAMLGKDSGTEALAGIIRRVQEHEREKLTVTAAHHLESMREARALGMGPGMSVHSGGQGDAGVASPSQDRLLSDAVGDLLRRAEGEAAAVSELLEELRYEAEGLE
ncbi:unnamed protein product [Ectocarpus sp. 12 AP-2014]